MGTQKKKERLPSSIGPYKVLRTLGSGSMASVYLAEQGGKAGFRKKLALKVVKPEFADDPTFIKLLMREAAIGGLLRHPNIIQTLSFEQYEGQYVLVLEFVAGQTVQELLRTERTPKHGLHSSQAIDICVQICRALDYAHSLEDDEGTPLQIIHRDLKPANLMLSEHGVVKIMDFGIARAAASWASMTAQGVVRGTPAYMSPEQVLGSQLDGRSDLFSTGAIFCELITGKPIFRGRTMLDVMERVARLDIGDVIAESEALLTGVTPILERLLTQKPDDRFSAGAEVAQELKKLLKHGGKKEQKTASFLTAIEDLSSVTAIAATRPKRSRKRSSKSPEDEEKTALSRENPRRRRPAQLGDESSFAPDESVEAFIYEDSMEEEDHFVFEEDANEFAAGESSTTGKPESVNAEHGELTDPGNQAPTPASTHDEDKESAWDGKLASEFFGADQEHPSRGSMGPSDPSEETQIDGSSRPEQDVLATPTESEKPAVGARTSIPKSVITDDLERDILDAPHLEEAATEGISAGKDEDDELWSDAPAEGSALLAEAMEAFDSSGGLDPDSVVEDDELWGLEDDERPSMLELPLSTIEERDPVAINASETSSPVDNFENTAEQLVAAVRTAVESTEELVAKTLTEFPAASTRKAEKRKENMEEKVDAARGALQEVERAVAAVAEADTQTAAETHLKEAQKASKSVEKALNNAVHDGQEAMRLARSAISRALEESGALKAAVKSADSDFAELEDMVQSIADLRAKLAELDSDFMNDEIHTFLLKVDTSEKETARAMREAKRMIKRVRSAAKSSTAEKHGQGLQQLLASQKTGYAALSESGAELLAEVARNEEAERERLRLQALKLEELAAARVRVLKFAEASELAADEASGHRSDLEESIRSFEANGKSALRELTLCKDAEEAAQEAAEEARTQYSLAENTEEPLAVTRFGGAAKIALDEARERSNDAKLAALRGRRAAASEATDRAASEAADKLKREAEEAEAARLRRIAAAEKEAEARAKVELELEEKRQAEEELEAARKAEEAAAELEARIKREEEERLEQEQEQAKAAERAEALRQEDAVADAVTSSRKRVLPDTPDSTEEGPPAEDPNLSEALHRAQEARRQSDYLVRRLEACGTIPPGSDLERLLADAQNRCSEVNFATEELEELLASPGRRSRISENVLLKKSLGLAERAELAAQETETSVQFAAQLGGLDLPSLSDVPAATGDFEISKPLPPTEEVPSAPAEDEIEVVSQLAVPNVEESSPEVESDESAPSESPDTPSPEWLSQLIEEAKETGGKGDRSFGESTPETPEQKDDWQDDWGF